MFFENSCCLREGNNNRFELYIFLQTKGNMFFDTKGGAFPYMSNQVFTSKIFNNLISLSLSFLLFSPGGLEKQICTVKDPWGAGLTP